ncbi:GntR family transcriptional regulator [Arthrobacter sp. SDTb3-6]|uniref:GntR family transcriptional regulator n=1 Tax=Arthrobacter sp. SDTb3-6 TaxID=2713571 RepID=UPI00159D888F|nr:GntR family transcriptional regulator [Arthrobacter sp. SDTb3-6]NVM99862.1 GntR family transcriptional regulator [Arthrobacter sp. SDTb3-6]
MRKNPKSNRARAYEFICENILPVPSFHGQFLAEEDVAEMIEGISRTPVREAFLLLGAEGLIQLVPRHGAFVPPITRQEVHEVLEFRRLMEIQAMHFVMSEDRAPTVEMRSILDRQIASASEGLERDFIELDTEFHLALVSSQNNSLITKAYSDLKARNVRIGMSALGATHVRQDGVLSEHEAIVHAMQSGDVALATQALMDHLTSTEAVLMK